MVRYSLCFAQETNYFKSTSYATKENLSKVKCFIVNRSYMNWIFFFLGGGGWEGGGGGIIR